MVAGEVGDLLTADLSRDPQASRQLTELLGPHRAAHGWILLSAAARGDLPYDVDVEKVHDLGVGTALLRRFMNRSIVPDLSNDLTTLVLAGPCLVSLEASRVRASWTPACVRRRAL